MKLTSSVEQWVPRCLWIIPVIFFGVLIYNYTAVSGTYTVVWIPGEKADLNITPLGRVSRPLQVVETGEVFQRVTGDPVYLNLSIPRSFENVTATVDLQNTGQPLIELGLQNGTTWQFDFHPLDVPLLDQLDWSPVTDDQGNVLYQKQPTFSSIQDFLNHLPLDQHIAEYHQTLSPPFVMSHFVQRPAMDIQTPLRGSQLMKVYAQNEVVSLEVTVQDLNRAFDDDAVNVSLVQNGLVLAQVEQADDGDVIADGKISTAHILHLETSQAVTGVVELHIDSTADLLITHLETSAGYLVAQTLFLAGNSEYSSAEDFSTQATSLTTNTRNLQAITSHPGGLQTLLVGEVPFPIVKINATQLSNLPDDSLRTLVSPVNDVSLVTQGWMSFTPESFFDPDYFIEQLTPETNLDQMDLIYAADLPPHTETDNTRTVNFDLTQLPGDRKQLIFILSAPGLGERKAEFSVSGIRFEFHRPPLTLKGILSRLTHRLGL